jgi:3-mercaptopyruvate sulfurtransferase SseA
MNAPRLAARAAGSQAYLLTGGIMAWKAAGLPVTEPAGAGFDPLAGIRRTVSALFGGRRG